MDLNGDILKTILTMLGIKNARIETDHPDAVITITYERYGQRCAICYTLRDLIEHFEPADSAPPPGYTDINDIDLPPEDLSG